MTFRGILNSSDPPPPFIILFSNEHEAKSEIIFTDPSHVPSEEIYHDLPYACTDPECEEECETVRWPRQGLTNAMVVDMGAEYEMVEMCNLEGCIVQARVPGSESPALRCSRCKLVKYCTAEHQALDWEDHKRVCVKSW